MRKIDTIKKKIHEIASVSTAHGIPNIVDADKLVIKLMWLFFFLISVGGCAYFICNSVIDFLNFDVVTKIDVVHESASIFPAVSFCANSKFNLSDKLFCLMNLKSEQNTLLKINFTDGFTYCYQYNGKPSKVLQFQAGADIGFSIGLKINDANQRQSLKMVVFIHNQSINPLTMTTNNGFEISPGSRNSFSVERVFSYKLNAPYNDCLKDPFQFSQNMALIKFIESKGNAYTQEECLELCFEKFLLDSKNCSCANELGKAYSSCVTPRIEIDSNCYFGQRSIFYGSNPNFYCSQYCPLECDVSGLKVTHSFFDYPSSGIVKQNDAKNLNKTYQRYEEVKQSYFEFVVYYPALKYTVIDETPKTTGSDLIAIIGGLVGLFLEINLI